MTIITISRGCEGFGEEVAEQVAKRLGYRCISREILVESAASHHVSEQKLFKALHDSPSFFEKRKNREKYLNMIKATLLEKALEDNLVYHGNAGHFLLPNIPSVFKIRIVANMETRIEYLIKTKAISREEAKKEIEKEDRHRMQWTHVLYKTDLNSPYLYDLMIHIDINKLDVNYTTFLITDVIQKGAFTTTRECQDKLKDEYILAMAKIYLEGESLKKLYVKDGVLFIAINTPTLKKTTAVSPQLSKHIEQEILSDTEISLYRKLHGIKYLKDIVFLDKLI